MPIKSTTKKGWGEGKKRKKKKIPKNLQNKSKHKNNKNFSWVTAVRVLSLTGSHSPPHLPRMPSNTVLVSRPAVGAAQILIWSYSCVFLPPMSTAIRTSVFSLVGTLSVLFIYSIDTVCLVDCVDLICSLYSWLEGFESSSLATLPWLSTVVLFSPLHMGCPLSLLLRLPWRTWVCPSEGQVWRWWSCLGGRGSGSTRYSGKLMSRTAGNTVV